MGAAPAWVAVGQLAGFPKIGSTRGGCVDADTLSVDEVADVVVDVPSSPAPTCVLSEDGTLAVDVVASRDLFLQVFLRRTVTSVSGGSVEDSEGSRSSLLRGSVLRTWPWGDASDKVRFKKRMKTVKKKDREKRLAILLVRGGRCRNSGGRKQGIVAYK